MHLEAQAKPQVSLRYKQKRPGTKRPIVEGFVGRELRVSRGDYVSKERLIDRGNDQYRELIVSDEGEVIRDIDGPLSKHQGRGSAKFKKPKTP